MFWLEYGDTRSGQYVLYDMKVRKNVSKSEEDNTVNNTTVVPVVVPVTTPETLQNPQTPESPQTPDALITSLIEQARAFRNGTSVGYTLSETWAKTTDNQIFKIITFVDNHKERLNVLNVQKEISNTLKEGKEIKKDFTDFKNSELYSNYADKYGEVIEKCETSLAKCIGLKEMELNMLSSYVNNAISVGKHNSTPYVLIVKPLKGEVASTEVIDIDEFKF